MPIDTLIDLLSDPDLEVRENISWTIREPTSSGIGKQEAIGPLNLLLGDKDPKVLEWPYGPWEGWLKDLDLLILLPYHW